MSEKDETIDETADETTDKGDFYVRLRTKIRAWVNKDPDPDKPPFRWTEYLLAAPDLFHLLCKLVVDKDVKTADKAMLGMAIAYFVSPIDLIPDVILPWGWLDDIVVAAIAINAVVNHSDPEVVRKHWAGDGDVLTVIKGAIAAAEEMLGTKVWKKIKGMFKL